MCVSHATSRRCLAALARLQTCYSIHGGAKGDLVSMPTASTKMATASWYKILFLNLATPSAGWTATPKKRERILVGEEETRGRQTFCFLSTGGRMKNKTLGKFLWGKKTNRRCRFTFYFTASGVKTPCEQICKIFHKISFFNSGEAHVVIQPPLSSCKAETSCINRIRLTNNQPSPSLFIQQFCSLKKKNADSRPAFTWKAELELEKKTKNDCACWDI